MQPSHTLRRRRLLAAAAPLAVLATASPSKVLAQAAGSTRVKFDFLSYPGLTINFVIWVARDKGYYSDEGIDVTLIPTTATGASMAAAVVSGSANGMLIGMPTVYQSRQAGVSMKMLGGILFTDRGGSIKKGRENDIPVAKGRGDLVRTLRALKGKTIGFPAFGSSTTAEFKALIKLAGLNADTDMSLIEVAPGPASEAALSRGTADLVYGSIALANQMESDGTATTVFTILNNCPPSYRGLVTIGVATSDKFLTDHPGFDGRFQRAMGRAVDFIKNRRNLDELVKIVEANGIKPYPGIADNIASIQVEKTIDVRAAQNSVDFAISASILTPSQPKVTALDMFAPAAETGR